MQHATVDTLSPRSKKYISDAEKHLRDKLRNSFHKVLSNCERLDTLGTGTLDQNMFRTALSRSFACRLSDAEFKAFHVKYHALPKKWVRLEHRPIDLKKVRGLFEDMVGHNDLRDPAILAKAELARTQAEKYVKSQLRLNYHTILRCFRALDLHETNSLPLEQFRRVLARYGGIRFTPKEWWGFSKLVDKNSDGRISLDEFEELFANFDDGAEAARARQLGDFVAVEVVEKMIAQSFADRLPSMESMLKTMDLMVKGEIRDDHFRRTFIRFGLVLSDPEAEALVKKYTIGDGNKNIDYVRFLHNIRNIVEEAEEGESPEHDFYYSGIDTVRTGGSTYRSTTRHTSPSRGSPSLDSRRHQRTSHGSASSSKIPLTARDKQTLVMQARRTGRLPKINTARGASRLSVNGPER